MGTVDLLRNGKAELLRNGWAKGTWLSADTGCMCAEGAVFCAANGGEPVMSPWGLSPVVRDAAYEAIEILDDVTSALTEHTGVAEYNDHGAKGIVDVLWIFDKAIEVAETEESK